MTKKDFSKTPDSQLNPAQAFFSTSTVSTQAASTPGIKNDLDSSKNYVVSMSPRQREKVRQRSIELGFNLTRRGENMGDFSKYIRSLLEKDIEGFNDKK